MHHRNREQRANRLHKDAPPFERAYVRAADQDALAARLGRRFQLRDNLGLRQLLTRASRRQARAVCSASGRKRGAIVRVTVPVPIIGHSRVTASSMCWRISASRRVSGSP